MADPYLIKKYSSRRLYDVAAGSFVTLAELDRVIRHGHNIRVVDTKGRDITRAVLLQILVEREQDGEPLLSVDMLHEMVRVYGNVMQGPFGRYLEEGMTLLRKQRKAWREALPDVFRSGASTAVGHLLERQMQLWRQSQDAFFSAFDVDRERASRQEEKQQPNADDESSTDG